MRIIYKPQNRKSIGIYPSLPDIAEVRYPIGMSKEAVDAFVEKHRKWAEEHLLKMAENRPADISFGGALPFWGREIPVIEAESNVSELIPEKHFILPATNTAEHVQMLYRKAAQSVIPQKVCRFAQIMEVNYSGIKINGAKTRWGSCNGTNGLNFSFYLMTAPESAVDYVVIHELAHTVHHNHSKEFWAFVERFCPDYKLQKKLLNDTAARLRRINI